MPQDRQNSRSQARPPSPYSSANATAQPGAIEESGMSVDGFGQVLSMLQFADETFRNSILRRIAQRDRDLALRLHRALNDL